jgi:hypothetical protein
MLTMGCGTTTSSSPLAPQRPSEARPAGSPVQGPKPVKQVHNAVDVHKVRWTSAKPVSGGKKIKLVWWSGVEPCSVLDRVKVKESRGRVVVTLYEGASPKAKNVSCIMIAVQKTTTVKLRKALGKRALRDGAR